MNLVFVIYEVTMVTVSVTNRNEESEAKFIPVSLR